jgi:hypothetical protein
MNVVKPALQSTVKAFPSRLCSIRSSMNGWESRKISLVTLCIRIVTPGSCSCDLPRSDDGVKLLNCRGRWLTRNEMRSSDLL